MRTNGLDGPRLLHRERTGRGYSQDELASAAGLSTRTVRELERGAITRPRRDTLTRIVDALALTLEERTAFLVAWGLDAERRVVTPDEMLFEPHRHADLLTLVRHRMDLLSTVYARDLIVLDASRRIVHETCERVAVATVSGLQESLVVSVTDSAEARTVCRNRGLTGCTVRSVTRVDEVTAVEELDFGRRLARDEAHYYSYERRFDFMSAVADTSTHADPWEGRCSMIGMHRGPRACVVEVAFVPGDLPARCVQLLERRLGGGYEVVRELEVDRAGHAQVAMVDPLAGWHGIGWEW